MLIEETYKSLTSTDTTGVFGYSSLFQNLSFSGYSIVIEKSWHKAEQVLSTNKDSIDFFVTVFDDNDNFLFKKHLFQLASNYADSAKNFDLNKMEESISTTQSYWAIDSLYLNASKILSSTCIESYQLRLSSDKTYLQDFVGQNAPCFDQNDIMNDSFWRPEEGDNVQHSLDSYEGSWKITNETLYLLGNTGAVIYAYPILHLDETALVLAPSRHQKIYLTKVMDN